MIAGVSLFLAWLLTALFAASPSDFYSYYAAGKLALTNPHSLYSLEAQAVLQRSLGNSYFLPWVHPAAEALLFAPFTFFRYAVAFDIWVAISLTMLAIVIWLLRRDILALSAETHYALMAFAYTPLAGGLTNGQDHILFLLLWVGAYRNLEEKRYFTAGMLAGLSLIRYQFTVPMLLFFLLKRQWRFLAGATVIAIMFAAASRALVGPSLVPSYLHALEFLAKWHDAATVTSMPTLRGFLGYFPFHHPIAVSVAISVVVLAWALWAARQISDPMMFLSFAIVISVLVDYHAFLYELPVVILPLLRFLRRHPRAVIIPWAAFGLFVTNNITGLHSFGLVAPLLFALAFWIWRMSLPAAPEVTAKMYELSSVDCPSAINT
jgi:hypothetical protein